MEDLLPIIQVIGYNQVHWRLAVDSCDLSSSMVSRKCNMIKKRKERNFYTYVLACSLLLEQRAFLIKKQNVPEIIEILVVEPMLVTRSGDVPLDLA